MMDRRAALQCLAGGAVWPLADHWISGDVFALLRDVHAAAQFATPAFPQLDSHAAATLTAACDRIIPADGTPGAVAARVPQFIGLMLAEWYEPEERDSFLRGLQTLDARTQAASGRTFVQSTTAQQDALLTALDEEVQGLNVDSRSSHWFAMLKYLTVWGYCTSEVGMKTELGLYPQPMKYDGASPYKPRT